MRMDKFTTTFQHALGDAQSLALGRDHSFIEPEHLMLALLSQEGGSIRPLLARMGAATAGLQGALETALERLPTVTGGVAGEVHVSNDLGRLLNLTDKLAQQRKDAYISSELFLLAAVEDKGRVGELLRGHGISRKAVEDAINTLRSGQKVTDPNAEEARQALQKYTLDLTARAESGKLDPVIGRDEEIRRQARAFARHGCPAGGFEVSWRLRGAAQGCSG